MMSLACPGGPRDNKDFQPRRIGSLPKLLCFSNIVYFRIRVKQSSGQYCVAMASSPFILRYWHEPFSSIVEFKSRLCLDGSFPL